MLSLLGRSGGPTATFTIGSLGSYGTTAIPSLTNEGKRAGVAQSVERQPSDKKAIQPTTPDIWVARTRLQSEGLTLGLPVKSPLGTQVLVVDLPSQTLLIAVLFSWNPRTRKAHFMSS